MGISLLALSGSVAYYGMMLLVWSKQRFQRHHPAGSLVVVASYGDLMFHTFGAAGRITVDVLLALSTVACGISYFTFICENLASIAESIEGSSLSVNIPAIDSSNDRVAQLQRLIGAFSWTSKSVYACMLFPLEVALAAIPSITYLAPLSTLADAVNFCGLGAVMVTDVLSITARGFQSVTAIGNLMAVPSAFGVGIYAFQSAGMMIPIEIAMEKPSKLGAVLGYAFILSGIVYAVFASLGYMAFGEETQQIITLNLQEGMVASLVKGALCVGIFFAFPLMLNPMCEVIERRFSGRKHSVWLRGLLVGTICVLAMEVKHFTDFLSLAGSSISSLLGFIIPAAVHLKVIKASKSDDAEADRPVPTFQIAANYVLILFGLVFGVAGTVNSFLNLL